jgi:site-specific recombinase XerD
MQPALSDYTRLLDTFLAGRNPRTLAAYQADLEDYRRFMEAIMEAIPWDVPTAGDAVRWLLGGSERLANSEADRYRSKMIKRGLPVTTINRRLATLRSLVKLANAHGLVTWTLPVENVPIPP